MDYQFFQEGLQGEMFWLETFPVNQSAFVQYTNIPVNEFGLENSITGLNRHRNANIPMNEFGLENSITGSNHHRNANKRMIEFMRRGCNARIKTREPPERERCHRHMINERMRREKQKQSYSALHSMLPFGTKNDKNSIIQMTVMKIQELERYKEELQRRNRELEVNLAAMEGEKVGVNKIKLRVGTPSSGIDSMVEVLQCLKNLGLKTRTIQSKYSAQEFAAELEIETKLIGAAEVEKAVQRTLVEVERKLLHNFPEGTRG